MKKLTTIILSLLLLLQNTTPLQATPIDVPKTTAKEIIVMDANTHQVVFGIDPYKQIAPASTTKLMTVLVAVESGVDLDTPVTIDTSLFTGISADDAQLNFSDNEVFTLRDMLYCTTVFSANDAAVMVAQCVGGSIEAFVDMMNQKAKEIGCKNTHFVTVNGLDADDHYSTAYDMCLIMARGAQNETFNTLFSSLSWDMPATPVRAAFTVHNTNNMSINPNSAYYIDGIVCSKIGFTNNARACEVSYVNRDGRSFIIGTFGGSGDEFRAEEQLNLVNYFCEKYQPIEVSQSYNAPALKLPYIYTSNVKSADQFEFNQINSIYAFSDTNGYPVTRKFIPEPLTKNAKNGDLAGYYNYYQNNTVIYQQAVYLTKDVDISISFIHILILIGIALASFGLFILIMTLIMVYLQSQAKKKKRKAMQMRARY